MADADPNKKYEDQRAALRDTAKWIVTILGATVVLVIGGGLVAKITDLDATQRFNAGLCLVALVVLCLIPLFCAIGIVSAPTAPLEDLAKKWRYCGSRRAVNKLFHIYYDARFTSVEALYEEYERQAKRAGEGNKDEKEDAAGRLEKLQPWIRQASEATNTEYLRRKFRTMVVTTALILPLIGVALFGFLNYLHTDTATEKPLAKPVLMNAPAGADIAAGLKQAGVADTCAAGAKLVQLTELSGLRAGVLIVPQDLGPNCPAVRAVIGNTGQLTIGN